jgi:hypothetical protein
LNIILGKANAEALGERYIVLELDTFSSPQVNESVTAYCFVDTLPISDMLMLQQCRDLHRDLIKNYKTRSWNLCHDAIDQLQGRWNGELDEFYCILRDRITVLENTELGPDWDGSITK